MWPHILVILCCQASVITLELSWQTWQWLTQPPAIGLISEPVGYGFVAHGRPDHPGEDPGPVKPGRPSPDHLPRRRLRWPSQLLSQHQPLEARTQAQAGGEDQRGQGPLEIRPSFQSNVPGTLLPSAFCHSDHRAFLENALISQWTVFLWPLECNDTRICC